MASTSPPTTHVVSKLRTRLIQYLIAIYQLVALLALAAMVFVAFQWSRLPFIGAFIEHSLLFNAVNPISQESWAAKEAGFEFGDQLVAIQGQEIAGVDDFLRELRSHQVGDQVEITAITPNGERVSSLITLQKFPALDHVAFMVIPWVIGLVYLGSGLWVFSLRYGDASGRIFALFTASVAIAIATIFDVYTTNRLTYLWTLNLGVAAGSIFNLAFIFHQETTRFNRWRFLHWSGYLVAFGFLAFSLPTLFDVDHPTAYIALWRFQFTLLGACTVFFLGIAALRRYTANSPLLRQQGRIVLLGALGAFTPITIWFFVTANHPEVSFSPYLLLPLAIFPMAVAYAILRYRLLNTDFMLSRIVIYALLTAIAVGGYALIVSGLSLIFADTLKPASPLITGLVVFILAILLNPLRAYLQWLVDTVFFRGQRAYQERLRAFGQDLNPALELDEIGGLLRKYVRETLSPAQLHIFLPDPLREYYVAIEDESGAATTDLRFATTSALPMVLDSSNTFIFIGSGMELPSSLQPETARIALLGAQVFVPLAGRENQLIGFMTLSPRQSGEPYTNMDLDFLTSLSDQAAITVERAQVVSDLERRVNEMNVLMRVAEGINITPQFDDILELIYAQTNRLIPIREFWILLHDSDRDIYEYAFYLKDDIRLLEHENRPLQSEGGLSREVVRAQRAIVTGDYERECRKYGFSSIFEGLYAWMGVPLNAGAETIGSISLASRDPSVVYSDDQVSLLQAIADQAAGAIVKTRLLDETQRRARQLSLLNEIGRNLTSTLDLKSLLNQILVNAIEIIGCEAGTLFLIDADTDELIFEVVAGPVADELVGQRLAPGTGHVGRAVTSRQPAIVNEVHRTEEWASKPDEKTGFQTRNLLLVPMVVQDRVTGVIEVINRSDDTPFSIDDQDLLTAYSSQAAIALENARLYTLTDQQLAARVDELSAMQRIDRELNASLDIQRAMRITLDWAMRQSGADAGLVGSVEEDGLLIMADQGYDQELEDYHDSVLPIDQVAALRSAVGDADTQIIRRSQTPAEKFPSGILEDMRSQMVYPIRREDQVIGVLLLESRDDEAWAPNMQDFLSRLSDHAAIAIANAQLFAQVQAADIAKSDFVSFVAHELKTPMTSIRGYADLLLGGAMGEFNEGQANFLRTILSNVSRMATLVSDLTDISRIEAGRLRLEYESVNVAGIVNEVSQAQGHSINAKNQTLDIQIPESLPPVWGDRLRLVQVLANLISNANKYSAEGGSILIWAEQTENQWNPDGAAEVVRIGIKDDGIGMTEEDQEQIFSKFFRSEDPQARESPGSGLGLNITKNLIEMQGGMIWFESKYGKGTTFNFTVPVAQI